MECPFCSKQGPFTSTEYPQPAALVVQEDALVTKYNEVAQGRTIQLCPRCWGVAVRPKRCHNHLFCRACGLQFCLYCRQKFTPSHFNPFSKAPCKHLRI